MKLRIPDLMGDILKSMQYSSLIKLTERSGVRADQHVTKM